MKKIIISTILFSCLNYAFAQPIYSRDGKILLVEAQNDAIMRINSDTGKSMSSLRFSKPIYHFKYTSDDCYIIVSSKDEIYLLYPDDMNFYKSYKKLGTGKIFDADLTPDQKNIIATSQNNNQIIILNAQTGKVIKRITMRYTPATLKMTPTSKFAYITTKNDKYFIQMDLATFNYKYIRKYY